ncbi:ADP-ribosylation factor-like protein 6-interacting protein 4 [Dinochytrium kinnereticum]|nr:ADP-ribosylation factor-like protein 6-interacting protein 4 [Dinochytrium kinnereticum]
MRGASRKDADEYGRNGATRKHERMHRDADLGRTRDDERKRKRAESERDTGSRRGDMKSDRYDQKTRRHQDDDVESDKKKMKKEEPQPSSEVGWVESNIPTETVDAPPPPPKKKKKDKDKKKSKKKKKEKKSKSTDRSTSNLDFLSNMITEPTVHDPREASPELQGPIEAPPPTSPQPQQNNQPILKTGRGRRSTVPQRLEEYKQIQSVIRRVRDPYTGRMRLVKGTGEIIEEIVPQEQQIKINKLATHGDGVSYSAIYGMVTGGSATFNNK